MLKAVSLTLNCCLQTSTPAPATEHFLSQGMREPLQGVSPSSSSEEGLAPKTSPVRPHMDAVTWQFCL